MKRGGGGDIELPGGWYADIRELPGALQTCSHLFNSPRPCPHSRLGSCPPERHPITLSRVGHRHPNRFTSCSSQCAVGFFESGYLLVTVWALCADLCGRSGRQGSAGVQPEHLAVLGLQKKHPARTASLPSGFLGSMLCKPRSKAKNSLLVWSGAS